MPKTQGARHHNCFVNSRPDFIVSTYHKTGTNVIQKMFQNINKICPINYLFHSDLRRCYYDVLLKHKCIVVIRHPYEIIMSGVRYHSKCGEKNYNKPLEFINNKTYREHLNDLTVD